MQIYQQNQTVVSPISGCESVLAGFGLPGYTGRPLEVARALASAGLSEPILTPDQVLRQQEALWQAGLGITADTTLGPLAEAQRINTSAGSGISTGAVSRRIDLYAFLGAQGDTANLEVRVTQQRQACSTAMTIPSYFYLMLKAVYWPKPRRQRQGRLVSRASRCPPPGSTTPPSLPPSTARYWIKGVLLPAGRALG
jgi:hypothetical protein